jgi:hypothetical protein
MTPLQSIAAKIAAAFSACHELAVQAGSTYELADFARILRSPAVGLTSNQRAILANTSEADLVDALHTEIASGRYDAALGRQQPEYPN